MPFLPTRLRRWDTFVGEGERDVVHEGTGKVPEVDAVHKLGVFRIDLGAAVWTFVVAEEVLVWHEYFPVIEALLDIQAHVLGDGARLFLCQ